MKRITEQANASANGLLGRRSVLKALGVAGAGAVLGRSFALPAMAAVGGELQIMAWEGYDLAVELKAWREANGVTTKTISITNQDDVQAKFVGGNPLPIDLAEYNQAYDDLYLKELRIAQAIDVSKVPNYNDTNVFPQLYNKPEWYLEGVLWGVPWIWGFNTLLYNPEVMDRPTSYSDLLDPAHKGKIAIADDVVSSWPVASRVAGFGDKFPNVTSDELAQIFDHFKLYREQARLVVIGMGDMASLLASGELHAALCADPNINNIAAEQGVKLEIAIPREGPVLWIDSWFIPISADNVDTAHAFMNASLDPKVQAEVAMAVNQFPVSPGAVEHLSEAARSRIDYDNLDAFFAGGMPGIPPTRTDTGYATYDDWVRAWEGFKAGL